MIKVCRMVFVTVLELQMTLPAVFKWVNVETLGKNVLSNRLMLLELKDQSAVFAESIPMFPCLLLLYRKCQKLKNEPHNFPELKVNFSCFLSEVDE